MHSRVTKARREETRDRRSETVSCTHTHTHRQEQFTTDDQVREETTQGGGTRWHERDSAHAESEVRLLLLMLVVAAAAADEDTSSSLLSPVSD